MYESAVRAVTSALSAGMALPVRSHLDLSPVELEQYRTALPAGSGRAGVFELDGESFIGARIEGRPHDFLILGLNRDTGATELEQARAALEAAATGLREVAARPRRLLDSSRQLETLSGAIIAISGELQLEAVLRTITDLARTVASARYAALGVPDAEGRLETFVTAGISGADEARIGRRPQGLGLLGKLLTERSPVRLEDLTTHPDSSGFPEYHPPMRSFLGVPIIARSGEIIGSLYLAEKRGADAFSIEDEMLIELLARHAAVAIENARLYRRLEVDEQRLDQILDQLPEAVMLIEPAPDRIVVMNQQARRLLGIELPLPVLVEELDGRCAFLDVREQPIAVDDTPFVRALREGVTIEREEMTVTSTAGGTRTLLVNSAPVRFDEVIDAYICVFQDITEIRDADRLKDDFLSLVSHELRTPLTTIHGAAQLLMKEADDIDRELRDELLSDLNQESARLAALIQNLVQLTHVRAGRVSLEPEPVLLRAVVARSVKRMESLDPAREYRVDIGPEVVALANADRVDEMLRNVMHNALKYTPDGTPIDITARDTGQAIELAVRDRGPGIPEDELPYIFERFERGARAASGTPGMGLGLYLVRLLVQAQGGMVGAELPKDGGTRIVFTLPRATAEE